MNMHAAFAVTLPRQDELIGKVDHVIDRARCALLAEQHPEGYWQAALELNAEMSTSSSTAS